MSSPGQDRRATHARPLNTALSSTATMLLDSDLESPLPPLPPKISPTDPPHPATEPDSDPPLATRELRSHSDEDIMQVTQTTRRRSTVVPNSTPRPAPYTRRRSSNMSTSSSRRGSLPTLHLRASSSALPTTALSLPDQHDVPMQEDLYSNLQNFTFGDAVGHGFSSPFNSPLHTETISPFTRAQAPSGPIDWTPRASISTVRSRDGQDEDEAVRAGTRAKMRAIDDGGRRPSLPTNEATLLASRLSPTDVGHSLSDRDQDLDNFATIDSDMETEESEHEASQTADVASILTHNTFGSSTRRDWSAGESSRLFPPVGERRGSLPISIRRASNASVSRDMQHGFLPSPIAQSRRGSRSVDDDIHIISHSTINADPSISQPLTRGEWALLEQHHHQVQHVPDEEEPASDVYQGFNLDFIYDNGAGGPASGSALSHGLAGPAAPSMQDMGFGASWLNWGTNIATTSGADRRPSTATVATIDDPFMKHIKRMDPEYLQRHTEWSFKRETLGKNAVVVPADDYGPPHPGPSAPPTQRSSTRELSMQYSEELWRCQVVGRLRISKRFGSQTTDKPGQQHLHVRHIVDPFSRGNKLGGPDALVHKHSRAMAFSIYRMFGLFGPNKGKGKSVRAAGEERAHSQSQSVSTQVRLHTEQSVLLATKTIQEHFTSTRTVGKLSTHGLLKENDRDRHRVRVREESPGSSRGGTTGATNGRARGATINTLSPLDSEHTYPPRLHPTPAGTVPRLATAMQSPAPIHPDRDALPSEVSSDSERQNGTPPSGGSSPSDNRRTSDDVDSDQENDYTAGSAGRTSHAEAFATLDPSRHAYMRSRTERDVAAAHQAHFGDHEHSPRSGFARITRRLLGGGTKSGSKSPPPTAPPSAVMEGQFNPPWVTLTPRNKQEEQERAIKVLNDSFFEVGLLPSFRPSTRESSTRRRPTTGAAIFEPIPDDSLYMLLPLWPGEADSVNTVETDRLANDIPVDQRRYLLVWYVPFQKSDKEKGKEGKTKRVPPQSSSTKQVSLSSYRVVARLVSYGDLSGSGVRLPPSGLSVTGSVYDAMLHLPEKRDNDPNDDELGVIIAVCHSRENGVELLPEGLEKLGLSIREDSMDLDTPATLSPIGRAAVELAWIGCMAVMGYGPSQTKSTDPLKSLR